jgi:hypothetical protein
MSDVSQATSLESSSTRLLHGTAAHYGALLRSTLAAGRANSAPCDPMHPCDTSPISETTVGSWNYVNPQRRCAVNGRSSKNEIARETDGTLNAHPELPQAHRSVAASQHEAGGHCFPLHVRQPWKPLVPERRSFRRLLIPLVYLDGVTPV